nr:hypothetical protein [Desulfobulbaceae bacterium]
MSIDDIQEDIPSGFKHCTLCTKSWPYRKDLLEDDGIRIIGYQPSFKNFAKGYIFFLCSCETTLGLRIRDFDDLYDGPRYKDTACSGVTAFPKTS